MIRAGESTITELKVQIEHLQEEARLLRNQLGASERRFSRRAERRIRAALQPFWPTLTPSFISVRLGTGVGNVQGPL
jgi:hypothetical protein